MVEAAGTLVPNFVWTINEAPVSAYDPSREHCGPIAALADGALFWNLVQRQAQEV